MLNEFLKYIEKNKLIRTDDRVLLAVSGGIDSMVMTHLFLAAGIKPGIAHCNFCLRARESDKDEELVREFAAGHNIPFFSKRFETKAYAKKMGISVQMAARELRFSWFEEIRDKNRFDVIAVAHNLNDNIETLLINLTRGTGITGLTGMKPVSNKIIRPLLFATRQEITDYCNTNHILFREDQSNAETKYTRNKIRHQVIPVLKEINPSIEATLNETAERLSGINEIVQSFIGKLRERIIEQKSDITLFNISLLQPFLDNKSVIFELFKPYGVTEAMVKDLSQIINGETGSQIFTSSHRIIKNRKELIVSTGETHDEMIYLINTFSDFVKVPEFEKVKYFSVTDKYKIPSDPLIAFVDSEKVSFPVTIRKWRTGDYFYPLGMKKKKKLSDYFVDNKFSLLEKEKIQVVESAGKIVWVIGKRIDNRFRITKSTRKALVIKCKNNSKH
jgi:tRNA(Ile)-lysidine synthase